MIRPVLQTSVPRALLAVFLAPAIVVPPVALLLLMLVAPSSGGVSVIAALGIIAAGYMVLLPVSVPAAMLTWVIFRLKHLESGRNYSIAGAIEAPVCMLLRDRGGLTYVVFQFPSLLLCAAIGGMIATLFWLIARDRVSSNEDAPVADRG